MYRELPMFYFTNIEVFYHSVLLNIKNKLDVD